MRAAGLGAAACGGRAGKGRLGSASASVQQAASLARSDLQPSPRRRRRGRGRGRWGRRWWWPAGWEEVGGLGAMCRPSGACHLSRQCLAAITACSRGVKRPEPGFTPGWGYWRRPWWRRRRRPAHVQVSCGSGWKVGRRRPRRWSWRQRARGKAIASTASPQAVPAVATAPSARGAVALLMIPPGGWRRRWPRGRPAHVQVSWGSVDPCVQLN